MDSLEHNNDHHHHHAHHHHGGGDPAPAGGRVRVMGADWCGWTQRQKKELDIAGVEYEYIECTQKGNEELCVGVQGFPTLEIEGARSAGYKSVDQIQAILNES